MDPYLYVMISPLYMLVNLIRNGNSHVLFRRKQPSPEPTNRREGAFIKPEASANGKWSELLHASPYTGFSAVSPGSPDFDDMDDDQKPETLDRRYVKICSYIIFFD